MDQLKQIQSPLIREVRGLGLMVGIELKQKVTPYLQELMARGVLALPAGLTVMRFLPPLVISKEDLGTCCRDREGCFVRIDEIVALLEGLVHAFSPTYQEAGAVQYLVGQMQALGFDAVADEQATQSARGAMGRMKFCFWGISIPCRGMRVRREGDLLFGRGTVDAKRPLACFAAAAAQVSPPPGWRITVVGAVGGGRRFARCYVYYAAQASPGPGDWRAK